MSHYQNQEYHTGYASQEENYYSESGMFQPSGRRYDGPQQQTYSSEHPRYQVPWPAQPQPQVLLSGDATLAAALSYTLCWFTGLLFCLFGWQNRYIRFHALQSVAFFGLINIIDVGLLSFMFTVTHRFWHAPFLVFPALLAFFVVNAIAFVGWLIGMIQAARGRTYRLPFVGDLVWRTVYGSATVK